MITLTIIGVILGICILLGISSLIFWGLGCLVISVFGIAYTWTFWHGLVCALIYTLIKNIVNITITR